MRRVGGWKQKSLDFLKKKKPKQLAILPVSYLTCSTKLMLFQLPIHHQNNIKVIEVCFYSAISMYILLRYLLSVFVFICIIYLCINSYKYTNNYI